MSKRLADMDAILDFAPLMRAPGFRFAAAIPMRKETEGVYSMGGFSMDSAAIRCADVS